MLWGTVAILLAEIVTRRCDLLVRELCLHLSLGHRVRLSEDSDLILELRAHYAMLLDAL